MSTTSTSLFERKRRWRVTKSERRRIAAVHKRQRDSQSGEGSPQSTRGRETVRAAKDRRSPQEAEKAEKAEFDMKITQIDAIPISVPLKKGLTAKTAHGEHVTS